MPLNRDQFAHLLPHAGSMCLIDRVECWDAATIVCSTSVCSTSSHRRPAHPLAESGVVLSVCGIEYAAQAAALHGGLLAQQAGERAAPGWLAAARQVRLRRMRLDDLADDLSIRAESEWADGTGLIYRFTVTAGEVCVLDGRLTVILRQQGAR